MSMQTSKKSQHVYDYVIVGSGLTGLTIANAIQKETTNILVVESAETFGGLNRTIQTPIGAINNGLRAIPATDLSQKAIAFLEMLLMTSLSPMVEEKPPVTYEAGGLKPFVGFGDLSPKFFDQISYFTNAQYIKTGLQPHEWTQTLFEHYKGEFLPRSYVTRFHIDEGRVTSMTINGQKTVHSQNFIFTGPVKSLRTLLPEGILSAKATQKLSKNTYWTAVCLDLVHSQPVTTDHAFHVLNGTTQDEVGPCVGQFSTPVQLEDQNLQLSQWMTFIDDEEAEDTEAVGAALKKIKRQMKRAYPEALDHLKFERILVVPGYSGNGDLKLAGNQTLPGVENLWIASSTMNQHENLLGALLQAELVVSALGIHPLGTQVEVLDHQTENGPVEI